MKPEIKGRKKAFFLIVWICGILFSGSVYAGEIITKKVNLRAPAGGQIKEIRFRSQEEVRPSSESITTKALPSSVGAYVIDSPPIDGFVPYVAVTTTNSNDGEGEYNAVPRTSVVGAPTMSNPQSNFAIGIYDTGASATVINFEDSQTLNLETNYLTDNTTLVKGVTGEVDAWVSQAIGVFVGGLQILDNSGATALLTDTSPMQGESNVSVISGMYPGSNPDLVTAIGIPMSVFYYTWIQNDHPVSVVHNGTVYNSPTITMYDSETIEPNTLPDYPIKIPMQLRPTDAVWVQYVPTIDFSTFEETPSSPSIISGTFSTQSLFFVANVSMQEGLLPPTGYLQKFMLDTGAQITTVGTRVGSLLGLDPDNWEFQVPIIGVTGETYEAPGFYIDSIKIPALGQWLEFTNVPVVMLDILSPEGSTVDGIIGMNLFTEFNMLLRGGGFYLDDDPYLALKRISAPLLGDIAPNPPDGRVDLMDFDVFSASWMSSAGQADWNANADFILNGHIDLADLSVLTGQWLASN